MLKTTPFALHTQLVAYPKLPDNTAGLVGAQGCLPESLLFRHAKPVIFPPKPSEPQASIQQQVIFGGYLLSHFGHFLLESLSRLSVCRLFPDTPLLWLTPERPLSSWQVALFNQIGVHNRHVFIDQPTLLHEVIVPNPGFVISDFFSPEHADFLATLHPHAGRTGSKLWLSRSQARQRNLMAGYANEAQLETLLEQHGWCIFHPQHHTIEQQLHALAGASRLSGIEGSAYHLLMLFHRLETPIDMLARRKKLHPSFVTIAQRKNLNQRELAVESDLVMDSRGVKSRQLRDLSGIVSLLEET